MRFDPCHFGPLVELKKPTMSNELQQLLYERNSMRTLVPADAEMISTLQELIEAFYSRTDCRTKKQVENILLRSLGGAKHDFSFAKSKRQLTAWT